MWQQILLRLKNRQKLNWSFLILWRAFVDFWQGHSLIYAAALSFYTLLSALPLLLVLASIFGYTMHFFSDSWLSSDERISADLVRQITRFMPFLGDEIVVGIKQILRERGRLGLFGILTLFLSASQVFRALEFALLYIFLSPEQLKKQFFTSNKDKKKNNDRLKKKPQKEAYMRNYFLSKVIVAALLLSGLSVYLIVQMIWRIFRKGIIEIIPQTSIPIDSWISAELYFIKFMEFSGVAFIFLILFSLFHPKKSAGMQAPIYGALLFSVLWQTALYFFKIYLVTFSSLGALYGSFSAMIGATFWIFWSWIIFLYCSHFVRVLVYRKI